MEMYLQGRELKKTYKGRTVVNGVNVDVRPGEIVGLLGPNGAGKTTTFYMITGIVRPNGGSIYLNGADVTKHPMYVRARKGIGYLPQEPSIFRKLTVEENLMLILEHRGLKRKEQKRKADELVEEFGIQKIRKSRGYVLSGGERRRVEIARALATEPTYLLLDEPFTGIDPISVQDLQELMVDLKNRGLGVLITDHNVRETLQITDRSYIMYDSRILKSGSSEEILKDPEARRLYLGDRFSLDLPLSQTAQAEAVAESAAKETESKPEEQGPENITE